MPSERFTFEAEERPPFNRVVTTLLSLEQVQGLKKAAKRSRDPVSAYVRNLIVDHLTEQGLYDEDGEQARYLRRLTENELTAAELAIRSKTKPVPADVAIDDGILTDEQLRELEADQRRQTLAANRKTEAELA